MQNPADAPRMTDPAGILALDKPAGMTSHDVVDSIRRRFRFEKVGHAGTLDPMATGVLLLLIGGATRAQDRFLNDVKGYRGTVRLGSATTTQDREGEPTERHDGPVARSDAEVEAVLASLRGEIEQVPPMVSAKKHKGRPLYKYARQGVEVAREPRKVTIEELRLLANRGDELDLDVLCSKGTYVRTLADSIGRALGVFGHLSALRRTRSGAVREADLLPLEAALGLTREALEPRLLPV